MLSVCPDPPSGDNGGYKVVGKECIYEGAGVAGSTQSLTGTTVDECGDFLIDDFKDLTYAEKKKKFKEICPKGHWDGLTNLSLGKDDLKKTKNDDSGYELKKKHIIIFLLFIAIAGYFLFL